MVPADGRESGVGRNRTDGLRGANATLYQLSYDPKTRADSNRTSPLSRGGGTHPPSGQSRSPRRVRTVLPGSAFALDTAPPGRAWLGRGGPVVRSGRVELPCLSAHGSEPCVSTKFHHERVMCVPTPGVEPGACRL